jgi:hypothetical protein
VVQQVLTLGAHSLSLIVVQVVPHGSARQFIVSRTTGGLAGVAGQVIVSSSNGKPPVCHNASFKESLKGILGNF